MDDTILTLRRVFITAIALTTLAFASSPAHAARLFSGKRLVVAETDTIHDDVYVSGGNLTVRGVIDGDVIVAGGQLGVNGTVNGSVFAAGGQVEIYGDVTGSVRAAGGKLSIGARIGHDLVAAGGEIDILPDAQVGRDALLAGGRTSIDGTIDRNAKVGTGQLILGQKAMIGGDLDYASDRDMQRVSGASVKGKTTWYARDWGHTHKTPAQKVFTKMWMLGRFAVGVMMLGFLFIIVFPRPAQQSIEQLATQPMPSTGVGLLVVIGMPIAAACLVLVGILIGGWWVGAFLLASWLFAMALGLVVATMTFGRWLASLIGARGLALGWALLLGTFAMLIVRMVPFAGRLLTLVAMLAGLGALAMTMGAAIAAGRKAKSA